MPTATLAIMPATQNASSERAADGALSRAKTAAWLVAGADAADRAEDEHLNAHYRPVSAASLPESMASLNAAWSRAFWSA